MDLILRIKIKARILLQRIASYNLGFYSLCVITGVIGGFGAVIFRFMISLNQTIFSYLYKYNIVFSTAIGGLIVGFLVFTFAEEAKGHGVPEVMIALLQAFGKLRKRVALVKIIASSITIGSGGSAGREGPIAQIGAGSASVIGQYLHLKPTDLRILIVSGLVAGISGTFNTPLGALIFGLELFLPSLRPQQLISLVLASVMGKIIATYFLGDYPAFIIPKDLPTLTVYELGYIISMALIISFIGCVWVIMFYKVEDFFDGLSIPNMLKPMVGGVLVGLLAWNFPHLGIMGVGYEIINRYVATRAIPYSLLFVVAGLKLIATMFTIGSGGSGGVFSPSLVTGFSLGSGLALLFKNILNIPISDERVYGFIGMAIMFTAVAKAPLTTLVMIPEMTRDYNLFLPIMIGNSIAYIVSLLILGNESIYLIKVERVRSRRAISWS